MTIFPLRAVVKTFHYVWQRKLKTRPFRWKRTWSNSPHSSVSPNQEKNPNQWQALSALIFPTSLLLQCPRCGKDVVLSDTKASGFWSVVHDQITLALQSPRTGSWLKNCLAWNWVCWSNNIVSCLIICQIVFRSRQRVLFLAVSAEGSWATQCIQFWGGEQ